MTREEVCKKLKTLKNGDFIWAVSDVSLFKTYEDHLCGEWRRWLGYDPGDAAADYDDSMRCFKMADVPKVSKPVKMMLVGKLVNDSAPYDIGYVFSSSLSDAVRGHYGFGQHVLVPWSTYRGWNDKQFYMDEVRFHQDVANLKFDDVCFSEAECIAECRRRNTKYGCLRKLELIKKTISSLRKQLKEFTSSELMVDHEKLIADDLKVKMASNEDVV